MRLSLQETPKSRRSGKRKIRTPLLITPCYKPELLYLPKGYNMTPSAQKIFDNNFVAENLVIYTRYSRVEWKGISDLSNLMQPLSETLRLKKCFIEVYIDDKGKPAVGEQLNKRCIASFISPKRLKLIDLERICMDYRTDLISVDLTRNFFEVQIPHFTRYNYNSQQTDQQQSSEDTEEETNQQNEKMNGSSIINVHENSLNAETIAIPASSQRYHNQNSRSLMNAKTLQRNPSSRKNFNSEKPFPTPSGAQLDSANSHNQEVQKYSCLFPQQIYFSANDKACRLVKRKNEYQITQPQRKQYQPCRAISMFLMAVTGDNQGLDQLIDKQIQVSFKMRRVAALLQILFFAKQSKVTFQRRSFENQVFKTLIVSQKTQKQNLAEQKLKNWLEWMLLNTNNAIPKPEHRIYKKLVLRRPCKLAQQFKEMRQIDNAEFLCSIEDYIYRYDKTELNLISELQCIANEIPSKIPRMHWLAEMGMQVWYFIRTQLKQRISYVLKKYESSIDSHFQEYRLFALFLGKDLDNGSYLNILSDSNEQNLDDLLCCWMISYKLRDHEKLHYRGNKYDKYRYNLSKNIVFKLQRAKNIIDFLSAENFLSMATKNHLLRQVLLNKPHLCEDLKYLQWAQKQDIVHEVLGIIKMNSFEYHDALQQFVKIKSKQRLQRLKDRIVQLANTPELVLHYRQEVVQKHYNLIQTLKFAQLKPLIIVLELRLSTALINKNNLTTLLGFVKQLPQENGFALMNLLFPSFKKSKRMAQIWQQDTTLYNQMLSLYSSNKKAIRIMNILVLNNKLRNEIRIQ